MLEGLMALPIKSVFFIEQAVMATIDIVTLTLFVLQWYAERFHKDNKLGPRNIKYRFHRVGTISCLIQVALVVDPFTVHGIYQPIVRDFLMVNNGVINVYAIALLNQLTLEVKYVSHHMEVPGWLSVLTAVLTITTFLLGNITTFIGYLNNRYWWTAIQLFWLVGAYSILSIIYVFNTFSILLLLKKTEKAAERKVPKLGMALRATTVLLLTVVVAPLMFLQAFNRFKDKDAPTRQVNVDSYDFNDRVFIYGQIVVNIILLIYSWIPMNFANYQNVPTASGSTLDGRGHRLGSSSKSSRQNSLSAQRKRSSNSYSQRSRGSMEADVGGGDDVTVRTGRDKAISVDIGDTEIGHSSHDDGVRHN